MCPILCDLMDCSMPGFPDLHFLPEFPQTHLHWVNDAIQTSHPLSSRPLLLLPSIFWASFPWVGFRIWWPKYWSFSTRPSNEYSELISFRIDWFDLVTVQGAVKSLLQHHSSEASMFWLSAFFTFPLSHSYMTTGKNIALRIRTFLSTVMSLIFNMLPKSHRFFSKEQVSFNSMAAVTICSKKSRYTRSNRQVWAWSTKWSRGKANKVRTHWS